jgi:prolyl oligopeptidase
MRRAFPMTAAIIVASAAALSCSKGVQPKSGPLLPYPVAARGHVVDDYHGTKVADPYRWMEDVDSPATRAWVEAENHVTATYLDGIPGRDRIGARLEKLWNYERYDVPFREGGRLFFERNDGLQPQSVLYVTESLDSEPRKLLDPNTLSADGTVALSGLAVSRDGRYLAYSVSSGGSDWQEWHVRSVDTGKDLPDVVHWSKFSTASWAPDGTGFYYGRFAEPAKGEALTQANYYKKIYFHRMGEAQKQDSLVYERNDHKDWGFNTEVSDDGHYLIIPVSVGTDRRNMVFYKELDGPHSPVRELLADFDAGYRFLGNDGPVFYFWTDSEAPRGRVVAVDTRRPSRDAWREVIPQRDETLRSARLFGDTVLAVYLKDAHSQVLLFGLDGKPKGEVRLPGIGTASGFTGHRGDRETFYSFSSFANPGAIYRLDLTSGRSEIVREPRLAFDPDDFVTEEVFYPSKDGTKVPMFLTRRKDVKPSAQTPVLLYGYGGFNIALTPRFSVPNLVWMEMGGVYAQANMRGGGEYGEAWHQAGMLKNKQRVFDDFLAAAEWLIDKGYTSKEKLAISGASNGGLLIGAVLNQRPDLFGAALPAVGVMDMLRFQKFTIGWAWVSEYGSSDDPEMFPVLRAYSPLHNIKAGACYPPTLVTTADHDDRVVPAHSFKYTATLQAAQGCANPVLIRIETRAGHGAGKPVTKRIEEATDTLAFLSASLGIPVPSWS